MLILTAKEQGDPVKVVNDQVGNPTSTAALADLIAEFIDHHQPGIFHATCEGEATGYDLAAAIFALKGFNRAIVACTSREFLRPAPRPANSRLEKRAIHLKGFSPMPHWRIALADFLKDHSQG